MRTIEVNASKSYAVLVGNGILAELHCHLPRNYEDKLAVIISDSNVWSLYGSTVQSELEKCGYHVHHYIFCPGEQSKGTETYFKILNFLAEIQFARSDLLIGLGGGVVGDITGFTASTFLRGVSYIQIPTSLLAMVDSSVGGKTAINLSSGKNLVGSFYHPNLVVCDVSVLDSLPIDDFRNGCAEVIKYGILYDPHLFSHLFENGLSFDREYVIAKCVTLKRDVVAEDEFDIGKRQQLNLGHTIGHGIEAASKYTISHGQAIAIGLAIIAKAGYNNGFCNLDTYQRIFDILKEFDLPVSTDFSVDTIYNYALSDKKRNGSTINLIIPKKIGECPITQVTLNTLYSIIKAGL